MAPGRNMEGLGGDVDNVPGPRCPGIGATVPTVGSWSQATADLTGPSIQHLISLGASAATKGGTT